MKKTITLFLSVVIILCSFPMNIFAQSTATGNLTWTPTQDEVQGMCNVMGKDYADAQPIIVGDLNDDPIYLVVDFKSGGYIIFNREIGRIMEFTYDANSPYYNWYAVFYYSPDTDPHRYIFLSHFGYLDILTGEDVEYLFN